MSEALVGVSKHNFTVSPSIVMHLIKAQSGTLSKAVLENIQNSIDAGATKVEISINEKTILIKDDGHGFRSRAEIDECFAVFGFDHSQHDRILGRFGIGRGQLWSFATNVWRTNTFELRVDIERNGLKYDLVENLPPVAGLSIEGEFYEPKRTLELLAFERELKELCLYAQVPVLLNGELISIDPKSRKWQHETNEAWIDTSATARELTVYNLGVKVRTYPSWTVGVGGTVVTRPGVQLKLNMARNDILTASCGVWKAILPFLQKKGDDVVKRSKRLTEDQLTNLATRFLAGELQWKEVSEVKLVSDVMSNKLRIRDFLSKAYATLDKTVTVCLKSEASAVVEASHKGRHCFVLSDVTLGRFGATSVADFMSKLSRAVGRDEELRQVSRLYFDDRTGVGLKIEEDWREACARLTDTHTEVLSADWTKKERATVAGLKAAYEIVDRVIRACGASESENTLARDIRIGMSEVASAWTDGTKAIWFNRDTLDDMRCGMAGAMRLVSMLVHELLHEDKSTGSHLHDARFYENFERTMCWMDRSFSYESVGAAVEECMRVYVKSCAKLGVRGNSATMRSVEKAEQAHRVQ